MKAQAEHGGAFWDAVGPGFDDLGRASGVISADVLDAWFDPSPKVIEKIREYLTFALRTSPPTHSEGLVSAIAGARDIPRESIIVGGGSSDLMFAVLTKLLRPDHRVLILDPMYGEYAHILENVVGITPLRHALTTARDFSIDAAAIRKQIADTRADVVIVVNPNSPTGQHWDGSEIEALVHDFQETRFIVDETYVDFAGREHSLERTASASPNLHVIKSMSKVYALSGVRVGYLVGHPATTERLRRYIPPWAVSLVGQLAAIEALGDEDYYLARYDETHALRAGIVSRLTGSPLRAFPSRCNFLLLQLHDRSAAAVVARLGARGVYVRNCDSMSEQFHDDFIRIAVKDRATNERVVDALLDAVREEPA